MTEEKKKKKKLKLKKKLTSSSVPVGCRTERSPRR